jgi:hypothetical protein
MAMGNEGHRDGELIHSGDIKDIDVIVYAILSTALNCCRTGTRTGLRSHQSEEYYSAFLVLNVFLFWILTQLLFRYHWLNVRECGQLVILNTMLRVSYGYNNSLSAYIRTVQNVLGEQKNMIKYVDDTGELRGECNKRKLKPFATENDSNSHQT